MLSSLFRDQRHAMVSGTVWFAGFLITAALVFVDDTPLLGINRWIKPAKFFVSIALFMWTMGVYLYFLKGRESFARRVSWVMTATFVIEMVIITTQAGRGVRSHFNLETPLDAALFAVMGFAIVVNTIMIAAVAFQYFRGEVALSPAVLWGMRLGLIICIFGGVLGGYMSSQTGHTVGAPDGGPGLPFVNWSTVAGDLRIAHFLGLHALQTVPLFALAADRLGLPAARMATFGFAAIYFAAVCAIFVQALMGRPLIAI